MISMFKPFGDDREKEFLQEYVNYMTLAETDVSKRELEIAEKLKDCEIVQADVDITIDEEFISGAPKLKYILCTSVGVDYVDIEAADRHGIVVANNPDFCNVAVAEYTMALLYTGMRRIPEGMKAVSESSWERRNVLEQRELLGKTLGIIGFGKIGRDVARQAAGIGMKVQVKKSASNIEAIQKAGIYAASFEELLQTSDVISIHVPLTANTRDMIGEKEFDLMREGTYLINVARGGIVSESALINNLNNGKLSGAAIDVLVDEPPDPDNPLLNYNGENLIITPHMAWFTKEAEEKNDRYLKEQVKAIASGNMPEGIVNR